MRGEVVAMHKEKPSANFNFGKKKMPKLVSGEDVTVVVKGKITGFHSEYGNGFSMSIASISTDTGMVGDLKKLKAKRKM
ncbi:MAG: hypothetical protein ACE5DO_07415 [Desulfobacterales bacterium]